MPRSPLYPDFPSVTEILAGVGLTRAYPDNPATLAARQRGKVLHRAIELHHKGTLDESSIHPLWLGYFDAYRQFLEDTGHKPRRSELEVISTDMGVVGHIDRESEDVEIIDYKSTDDLDLRGATLQLAGYRLLYEEMEREGVTDCLVLQLMRNGRYRLHNVMDDYATVVFRSAVVIFAEKGKR